MRISDGSSDVCSSDLALQRQLQGERRGRLEIAIEWTCREQGCRRAQYHLLIGKVFPNQCHFTVIVLGADGDNEVNQGIRFQVRRSHRRQLAELEGTEINLGVDPQVNAVRKVSPVFDGRVASPLERKSSV